MKQPLISVIIPVYNHAKMLRRSLSSLGNQTYTHFEVIVIDDGSQEPVVITNWGLSDDYPVKVIRQEHAGAPSARNHGFREAKGEYVIFWDSDVVAQPDMLKKMLAALEKHPHASYAYSNFLYGWKQMPASEFDPELLKKINYIHTTSLIRKKDMLSWDESLKKFQDWDLWLTMLTHHRTGVWIPEYLFYAVPHKSGLSSWLPAFAYKKPWRYLPWIYSRVKRYQEGLAIIRKKHHLPLP